jgi:predicted small metal-binding protein
MGPLSSLGSPKCSSTIAGTADQVLNEGKAAPARRRDGDGSWKGGIPMTRKVADCRQFPSEVNCTLTISGEEKEVMDAAVMHAVAVHGHTDTPEFREQLKTVLMDEKVPASH